MTQRNNKNTLFLHEARSHCDCRSRFLTTHTTCRCREKYTLLRPRSCMPTSVSETVGRRRDVGGSRSTWPGKVETVIGITVNVGGRVGTGRGVVGCGDAGKGVKIEWREFNGSGGPAARLARVYDAALSITMSNESAARDPTRRTCPEFTSRRRWRRRDLAMTKRPPTVTAGRNASQPLQPGYKLRSRFVLQWTRLLQSMQHDLRR